MNNKDSSLKLRNMPVGKLIFVMSMPAIFSMFVQALYNVIDTMYISKYDTNAVVALGYAFVIQMIILAFALGIGIGGNILISRKLGEGRKDDASDYGKTSLLLSITFGLIFFILSWFLPKLFMNLSSGVNEVREYGIEYLHVILCFGMFIMIETNLSKMLQSMGRMIVPMICQLTGAIVNIILDPIFIFNLGLGVKGAAIATILGQVSACLIAVIYTLTHKLDISLNFKNYHFHIRYVGDIFYAGIPTIIMNSIGAFVNVVLYGILRKLDPSELSIGVLSLYFKLQSFVFMPVFGLTQGGLPILSYNYGANIKERYRKCLLILFGVALSVMLVGFTLFQTIPGTLLSLFSLEEEAMNLGRNAIRIMSYSFLTAGVSIIAVNAFQSLGKGLFALLMSILRQAGLLIPLAIILSISLGVNGVWISFPIAEVACTVTFIPILIVYYHKAFQKKNLEMELGD